MIVLTARGETETNDLAEYIGCLKPCRFQSSYPVTMDIGTGVLFRSGRLVEPKPERFLGFLGVDRLRTERIHCSRRRLRTFRWYNRPESVVAFPFRGGSLISVWRRNKMNTIDRGSVFEKGRVCRCVNGSFHRPLSLGRGDGRINNPFFQEQTAPHRRTLPSGVEYKNTA